MAQEQSREWEPARIQKYVEGITAKITTEVPGEKRLQVASSVFGSMLERSGVFSRPPEYKELLVSLVGEQLSDILRLSTELRDKLQEVEEVLERERQRMLNSDA